MPDKLLTELQYLGPVSYYSRLMNFEEVLIESCENFEKSTYRNRCYIAGPNGKLRLSIPLEKGKNKRRLYRDVGISYDEDWQKNHWYSLCSTYRRSPYFEFYEDHFSPFYHQRYSSLFEFNLKLMETIIKLLDIPLTLSFTDKYVKECDAGIADERSSIRPQIKSTSDNTKYHQVFEDRNGFIPDVSIIDLLFNEGPRSRDYLK